MSDYLQSQRKACPWCGEPIEFTVDTWAGPQEYVEDCEVCCRPIVIKLTIDRDGDAWLDLRREGD